MFLHNLRLLVKLCVSMSSLVVAMGRLGMACSSAVTWGEELHALFAELEQQAEALYDAERAADMSDRSQAEYATVTLASRVMASMGLPVAVLIRGIGVVEGRIRRMGDGWFWLGDGGRQWLVILAAVDAISGASDRAVPEVAWSPVDRLGLGSALRRLALAEVHCVVHQVDGGTREGKVRRVGEDFIEVTSPSGAVWLCALASIAAVRSSVDQ
jgi:hypothetical protein